MLMPGLMVTREVLIEAPVEVVWRTITEPDQVSQWFADRVELYADEHRGGWIEYLDRLATLLAKNRS